MSNFRSQELPLCVLPLLFGVTWCLPVTFVLEIVVNHKLLVEIRASFDEFDIDFSWRHALVPTLFLDLVILYLFKQLNWCLWSKHVPDLLVKQLLDLSELFLGQLLFGALPPLLGQLEQSLLLP